MLIFTFWTNTLPRFIKWDQHRQFKATVLLKKVKPVCNKSKVLEPWAIYWKIDTAEGHLDISMTKLKLLLHDGGS